MDIPIAGDEKALRANAASFASALKVLLAMPEGGQVIVNRISGSTVTTEAYTFSAHPAKRQKLEKVSPTAKDPREVWKTTAFGAKAKLVNDIGAHNVEAVLSKLFPEKSNKAPARINLDQSLAWKLFSLLNRCEQAEVVPGSTARDLLPGMRNYKKFLDNARAIVGRLPVDEDAAADVVASKAASDVDVSDDDGKGGGGGGTETESEFEPEGKAEKAASEDEEVDEDEDD